MNTPPRRTTRPRTPTAPRHGADFEEYTPPRRSLRLKDLKSSPTVTIGTLSPPPSSPLAAQTPSPKRSKRKVRIALDDDVFDEGVDIGKGKGKEKAREEKEERRPSTGGMGLPTPAKTPSRKRKLAPEQVASTAQALFPPTHASSSRSTAKGGLFGVRKPRDTSNTLATSSALATPRRRSNAAGTLRLDARESSLEIFTDSVNRRPKYDDDLDNPFITHPGDETRIAKRTRQQRADRAKNPLGDAADREDGMVYTFRGKKIFKRFDRLPDHLDRAAPEDQDDEEAGLNPSKIRPRFLFSSAKTSKKTEPAEHGNVEDEEAETDIDVVLAEKNETSKGKGKGKSQEVSRTTSEIVLAEKKETGKGKGKGKRPEVSRMTPDSEDEAPPKVSSFKARLAASGAASKKRLSASKALFDEGEDESWLPPALKAAEVSDDEVVARPKKGVKRNLDIGLDTPPSTRKRTRRALY